MRKNKVSRPTTCPAIWILLGFLLLCLSVTPSMAWNPPTMAECAVAQRAVVGVEPSDLEYSRSGHAFVIERAIQILANDAEACFPNARREGYFRRAVAALMEQHLGDLLIGARRADFAGDSLSLAYEICAGEAMSSTYCNWLLRKCSCKWCQFKPECADKLGLAACHATEKIREICWTESLAWSHEWALETPNTASFEHYYPGLNLKYEDNAEELYLEHLLAFVDGRAMDAACAASSILHCRLQISPDLEALYRGADQVAQEHYELAVHHLQEWARNGGTDEALKSRAFQELGWALHLVADLGVPHHAHNAWRPRTFHEDFENYADGHGGDSSWHALQGGVYRTEWTAGAFVRRLASGMLSSRYRGDDQECPGRHDAYEMILRCPRNMWQRVAADGFRWAERYSSGLMYKLIHEVDADWAPPVSGIVRQYPGGEPLAGAYLYYRDSQLDEKGHMWQVLRADDNGQFSLPLRRGELIQYRLALPGWAWILRDGSITGPRRYHYDLEPLAEPKKLELIMKRVDQYHDDQLDEPREANGAPSGRGNLEGMNIEYFLVVRPEHDVLKPMFETWLPLPTETKVHVEIVLHGSAGPLLEALMQSVLPALNEPERGEEIWPFLEFWFYLLRLPWFGGIPDTGIPFMRDFSGYIRPIQHYLDRLDHPSLDLGPSPENSYISYCPENIAYLETYLRHNRRIEEPLATPLLPQIPVVVEPLGSLPASPQLLVVDSPMKPLLNALEVLQHSPNLLAEISPGHGFAGSDPNSHAVSVELIDGEGFFVVKTGREAGRIRVRLSVPERSSLNELPGLAGAHETLILDVQPLTYGGDSESAYWWTYPHIEAAP